MAIISIGNKIKKLRENRGIHLRTLAERVGVSPSFISQLENNKTSPSLVTLKNIADALGTTVSFLIGDEKKETETPVMKKEEWIFQQMGEGIKMFYLTFPDPYKQIEPLLFIMEKGASSGEKVYQHFGQEFVMVLNGKLEVTLAEKKYVIQSGDTIYFNSYVPHKFRNVHKGVTKVVWVDNPPTF